MCGNPTQLLKYGLCRNQFPFTPPLRPTPPSSLSTSFPLPTMTPPRFVPWTPEEDRFLTEAVAACKSGFVYLDPAGPAYER